MTTTASRNTPRSTHCHHELIVPSRLKTLNVMPSSSTPTSVEPNPPCPTVAAGDRKNTVVRAAASTLSEESFRSYARRRLQKFNGISARTFNLHLKECEYRFNNRNKDLSRLLLKLLERYPLQVKFASLEP